MGNSTISLASVSWIDGSALPVVGFWFVARAAISWPKRVIMGLAGTANPEPPTDLASIDGFRARRQFRALMGCKVMRQPRLAVTDPVLDAGYTPPFNRSKLDTRLAALAPIPDDPLFYPGESSSVSSIVAGKLHPCSTLKTTSGDEVVVSAFIKFRAGVHTDAIGIKDAKSPVHVPWVWCEYALVAAGSRFKLLAQGSQFPSHAWYVSGKQVAKRFQSRVADSDSDPAISTGEPSDGPLSPAGNDRSSGPAARHKYTLDKGAAIEVDVTSLLS